MPPSAAPKAPPAAAPQDAPKDKTSPTLTGALTAPAPSAPAAPPPPRFKFRVLAGSHQRPDGTFAKRDDIVETDVDLKKKFDRPGQEQKFERLLDNFGADPRGISVEEAARLGFVPTDVAQRGRAETLRRVLGMLDVEGLKRYAEEEGIDVGSSSNKDGIMEILLAHA